MKLAWTTIYVKDMEESLKYYVELIGLNIHHRLTQPDVDLVFLGNDDEALLELIEDKAVKQVDLKGNFSIGIQVESAIEIIDKLQKEGYELIGGPIQPNVITKFWFVKDPDGLRVQLVEIDESA